MGWFKKRFQKVDTDEAMNRNENVKGKEAMINIYDDGYFDEQLEKLKKILPNLKVKVIHLAIVTNADDFKGSLYKIDRIRKLDKRIIINITEPVHFNEVNGEIHQDIENPKILFNFKPDSDFNIEEFVKDFYDIVNK